MSRWGVHALMTGTYEHEMEYVGLDEQGWDFCRCGCGWISPPCPDTETAVEFWGDHIMEANGD